jgi:hypothetical protein
MVTIVSFPSLLRGLGIACRECNPAGQLAVEADLESILARPRQGNVEHQHRSCLDIYHSSRGLAELDGSLSSQQFISSVVDEPDSDGMHPDLSASAPYPQNQVGAGVHRRKIGEPDVLKDAEYAQLALLVDQGIVGDHGKIEMQLSRPGWM